MLYILGCDHYVQEYDLQESDGQLQQIERDLKTSFYSLLKELIETHNIQFIGEECKPSQYTIARALASELGCKYAEVDMSAEQREAAGIARDYQRRKDEEVRGYDLRENHMLSTIYRESNVAERKLIIVGAQHVQSLTSRFQDHGEKPTTRDLTTESWYKTTCSRMLALRFSQL